jgi:phosphopantetheinyl transferase
MSYKGMPLVEINRIGKNVRYGIWEITESLDYFESAYSEYLADEQDLLRIKDVKRRKESLAARLVVKAILEKDELSYQGISKNSALKPMLNGYDSIHINLSHSWPYAVATVNTVNAAGIDIEKISVKTVSIAKKFLSYNERNHAGTDTDLCTAYWCMKETLYKAHGKRNVIFKENLHVEPFDLLHHNNLKGVITVDGNQRTYDVHLRRFHDYLIACNY